MSIERACGVWLVCMRVHMCVYVYTCVYTCTHVCVWGVRVTEYVCVSTENVLSHTHKHTHTLSHTHTPTHTHTLSLSLSANIYILTVVPEIHWPSAWWHHTHTHTHTKQPHAHKEGRQLNVRNLCYTHTHTHTHIHTCIYIYVDIYISTHRRRIINRQTSRGKQLQIFSLSHAQPSVRPPTHLRNISQNNV